jgi:uncharacterized membrane protein
VRSILTALGAVAATSVLLATSAAAAPAAGASTQVPAAPAINAVSVHPRVDCGGSNGIVSWTSAYVEYVGTVWNNCSSGVVSVWLSWDSPTHHAVNIGRAGPHQHLDVFYHTGTFLNPGHIGIRVCSTHHGWHCGNQVRV